jgi:hypothetical protein
MGLQQLRVLAGVLLFELSSLGAIPATLRLWPRTLRKRAQIQQRRRRSAAELRKWFV